MIERVLTLSNSFKGVSDMCDDVSLFRAERETYVGMIRGIFTSSRFEKKGPVAAGTRGARPARAPSRTRQYLVSASDESVSIAELQVQMGQAIKQEDYILAAKLRDAMQ